MAATPAGGVDGCSGLRREAEGGNWGEVVYICVNSQVAKLVKRVVATPAHIGEMP